jgi:hypothetical protein
MFLSRSAEIDENQQIHKQPEACRSGPGISLLIKTVRERMKVDL